MFDMWELESQIHEENDDVTPENSYVSDDDFVHEDVKVDTGVAHIGVVNKKNEKRKYASKGKKNHAVNNMEKNVETLCEDAVSSDEIIVLGCSINNMYKVFNKHTKSTMVFIKLFVRDFQIKVEGMEDDAKDILHDSVVHALKKNKKLVCGKKIPTNVLISPLDNMSFHYKKSVLKWKDVYHKRIALERKLPKEALTFEEVVEILEYVIVKDNGILTIVQSYVMTCW